MKEKDDLNLTKKTYLLSHDVYMRDILMWRKVFLCNLFDFSLFLIINDFLRS